MDNPSRTLQLCITGIESELERRLDDARRLYEEAWRAVVDDHDACVAAHYVGHLEADPVEALRWHVEALARARLVEPERVERFYPSLYVNLGRAHERVGNVIEARRFYGLASDLGLQHQLE